MSGGGGAGTCQGFRSVSLMHATSLFALLHTLVFIAGGVWASNGPEGSCPVPKGLRTAGQSRQPVPAAERRRRRGGGPALDRDLDREVHQLAMRFHRMRITRRWAGRNAIQRARLPPQDDTSETPILQTPSRRVPLQRSQSDKAIYRSLEQRTGNPAGDERVSPSQMRLDSSSEDVGII